MWMQYLEVETMIQLKTNTWIYINQELWYAQDIGLFHDTAECPEISRVMDNTMLD